LGLILILEEDKMKRIFAAVLIISAFVSCERNDLYSILDSHLNKKYAIGEIGPSGVGIVFYIIDGGLHGLEVAPEDQSTGAAWSNIFDVLVNGISPLPVEIGTGSANTSAIIGQVGHSASAAKLCRDYRAAEEGDWFLPSRNELNAIWDNLVHNGSGGNNGVGGFALDSYWNSSENEDAWGVYARFKNFTDGSQEEYADKLDERRVRAIRVF